MSTDEGIRTPREVARRCVVLYAVIAAGHGEDRPQLREWLQTSGLLCSASPEEKALLECAAPTDQQKVNATWRVEALAPLLWALKKLPDQQPPVELCDTQALRAALPPLLGPIDQWVHAAQLRNADEIYEANEAIYNINWSVRDAQIFGKSIPNGYHPGIVQERHHALNWLIGYENQDWDEVATDT